MCNSLWLHRLQHNRLPCPWLSPKLNSISEFTQIHAHWVCDANYLVLFWPLLLLPSIFSSIRVFSNESTLPIKWAKVLKLQLQHRLSNEYSGLISFRIDWFGLLAVQGTLKSLLQHHNSKASILRLLPFFMVQLSHPWLLEKL